MAWAQTNALGTSIREMGPGAHHKTLNDQWSGLNFRKIVGFCELNLIFATERLLIEFLGFSFLKCFKEAYAMRKRHRLIFQQFSSTFPLQKVQQWEMMILEWENNKMKPNPYKERASSSSYCFRVIYELFTPILSHDAPRCSTRLGKRGSS